MDELITLYDILEIKKEASPEEIKAAYHTLAKKYHPDVSQTDNRQEFEEKFKKINEAYSTLSDVKSRKEYDNKLKDLEKEHLEKLIQDTQNQINQLKDKLQRYKEDLRKKQTFSFSHKDETKDKNYEADDMRQENTAPHNTFDDTFKTSYTQPVKLKKQILDILKYQAYSILKPLAIAAFIVMVVYTVIHFYFSELTMQTKNYILNACIWLLIFAIYYACLTFFATLRTILIIIPKSDKGLSFVKTNNVIYCINKAVSLQNSFIILILASITLFSLITAINNINDLFHPKNGSMLQNLIDFYSNNAFTFSTYSMTFFCLIYAHVVISMELAKYVCPSCHSAFSYFYDNTYYTEDGHHVEYNTYYRDYIKNEVTQCEVCGYQTTLSFRKKEKISQP